MSPSFPQTPELLSPTDTFVGREGRPYHPHPDLLAAANAALLLGVPLLLTGEPGCGKTHFAWAAAGALCTRPGHADAPEPLECYVRSDSRARDFLYHYDAIRRFGDAQHGGTEGQKRAQDVREYIELQALGRALLSPARQVLLIDEVDKAPRDLPNDLLRELDQGRFEIPEIPAADTQGELRRQMVPPDGARRPFIVITSNVERQLPDAFLRRCVFYHIPFPDEAQLRRIVLDHVCDLPGGMDRLLLDGALEIFHALREWKPKLTKRPATAELLAWLLVLHGAFPEATGQGALARGKVQKLAEGLRKDRRHSLGELPGLGCLLKLREDIERVGGRR